MIKKLETLLASFKGHLAYSKRAEVLHEVYPELLAVVRAAETSWAIDEKLGEALDALEAKLKEVGL